jgi:predicted ATPase
MYMRIAVSGTASTGKSTFVRDFLKKWPSYTTPDRTYRDVIKEKKLKHSDKTNVKTQRAILDFLCAQQSGYKPTDNVIFDRCPLDNLVYSLWACDRGLTDIDEKFIAESIPLVRESMRNLDIIFFIPITSVAPIMIEDDGVRQADEAYIIEVDAIFKELRRRYNSQSFEPFFPQEDVPALIEIFGNPQERLYLAGMYIDAEGDAIEGDIEALLGEDIIKDLFNDQKERLFEEQGVIYS